MSNDIINHDALNAREKELWAELEKIDATRRLWQEPPAKIQRKEVRPAVAKTTGFVDADVLNAIEFFGGMQTLKTRENYANGKNWITARSHGRKGYRIFLMNYGHRTQSGPPASISIGYYKTKEQAQNLLNAIIQYYRANKHNN